MVESRCLVNMVEINLKRTYHELGDIHVKLNSDYVCAGHVFPSGFGGGAGKCRITTSILFEMPKVNLTLKSPFF